MDNEAPPLVVELSGWRDPADVLPAFSGSDSVALLCSAGPGQAREEIRRWSLLCADPFETVAWRCGDGGDPLCGLVDAVTRYRVAAGAEWPFAGGAVGWIGYDVARSIESIPARAALAHGYPDLYFGLHAAAIAWDHLRRRWAIVATGLPHAGRAQVEAQRDQAEALREAVEALPAKQEPPVPDEERPDPRELIEGTSLPRAAYLDRVESARALIAAGDLYQVNLTQRLELAPPSDPVALFQALCSTAPAPFAAYVAAPGVRVISSSPERFLRLRRGRAESRPIKGTRPRGEDPARDARLLADLTSSAKDRAENVMIVDLVRNDLGRVCIPGSVTTRDLCAVESYASVHHLVSCVEGELRPDVDRAGLLRALFPGGSMTGAPKLGAMRVIEQLEPVRRGVYAGALGYLSFDGGMDLSIVIRTAVIEQRRCFLSVGGGVVADSDPALEHAESLHKAASVLRALAACRSARRRQGTRTAHHRSGR